MRRTSWPVAVARTLVASLAATIANPVWPSMATAMGCRPTGVVCRRRPDAAQAGGPRLDTRPLQVRARSAERRSRRATRAARDVTAPGHAWPHDATVLAGAGRLQEVDTWNLQS